MRAPLSARKSSPAGAAASRRVEGLTALLMATAIGLGGLTISASGTARILVGVLGALIFFIISTQNRDMALIMAIVWLTFLGFFRRLLIPFAGWSPQDPLLLVGPACAVMLWLGGRGWGSRRPAAMAQLAVVLLGLSLAQLANPAHQNFLEGAYASLFWVTPIIWFFVGRTLTDRQYELISRTLMVLLIPVLLHGLYQTFISFLPFEYTWIGVSGFGEAIFLQGFKIRPFSTLVSPQEYGFFLSLALTVVWVRILAAPRRRVFKIILFGVGTVGLFLQGSRSIFLLFLLMLWVTSIAWTRTAMARFALALMAAAVAAYVALGQAPTGPAVAESAAGALAQHQLGGLIDPTGAAGSYGVHSEMIKAGFDRAWDHPLGLGIGGTTIATIKAGPGGTNISTENDIGTAFVSLGILGGLAFSAFVITGSISAIRNYSRHRSWRSLAILGTCIVTLGYWLPGGMYSVSALVWMTLGHLAGLGRAASEQPTATEPVTPPQYALAPVRG